MTSLIMSVIRQSFCGEIAGVARRSSGRYVCAPQRISSCCGARIGASPPLRRLPPLGDCRREAARNPGTCEARLRLVDDLAGGVLDAIDVVRLHAKAAVGENRIAARDLQRRT